MMLTLLVLLPGDFPVPCRGGGAIVAVVVVILARGLGDGRKRNKRAGGGCMSNWYMNNKTGCASPE
jgi:hypothetical protein